MAFCVSGVSNVGLLNSSAENAYKAGDNLEKHHSLRAFELMVDEEVGLLRNLNTSQFYEFRRTVFDIIVATDMKRHMEYAAKVN